MLELVSMRAFGSLAMLVLGLLLVLSPAQAQEQQTEVVNGKTYIIHQIKSKETYYSLSRTYNIPVNDIMAANNKKGLRVGDSVRIPSNMNEDRSQLTPSANASNAAETISSDQILTEYKVGTSETLYSIAKRFKTNVNDIKRLNNLKSDNLREGQLLRIPDGALPPEPQQQQSPTVTEPEKDDIIPDVPVRDIEAKRYGVRETTEKGIGIWMNNLETRNNSNLALHKTAPIGTILKITNPISKSVTYAKVVGKFTDNKDTHDALVVISKSAAAYIGAVDKRFRIEITYGIPTE